MFTLFGILFTVAISLYIHHKVTKSSLIKITLPTKEYLYQCHLALQKSYISLAMAIALCVYADRWSGTSLAMDALSAICYSIFFPLWDRAAVAVIEVVSLLQVICEVLYEGFDSCFERMFKRDRFGRKYVNPFVSTHNGRELWVNTSPTQKLCSMRHNFCPKFWHEYVIGDNEPWKVTGQSYYLDGTPRLSPIFHNCYCARPITINMV